MSTALGRYIEERVSRELGERKVLAKRVRALTEEVAFLRHAEEMAAKRILELTKELDAERRKR